MAKPIKITPVLKGQDAVNFHRNLRTSDVREVSKATIMAIRKDAQTLRAIFKKDK